MDPRMDTQYTVVMDPDDVRLEPVEIDYEANKGDGFRERKLSDSFEPLERDDTGLAIDQCNKWVINPYQICLKVVGWYDFVENPNQTMKLLRWLWVFSISLVITTALITQILSCFRRDQFNLTTIRDHNETITVIQCNVSVVSIFVIPDLLLLATYFYGIYLFWSGHEYLLNLAGQVFIHCCKFTTWPDPVPRHLINTIFLYLILGVVYIIASLAVRIGHAVVFDLFDDDIPVRWPDNGPEFTGAAKLALVIFSLFGFIFFDAVYIVAVMNYAIQSELNIYLLHALRIKVERREHKTIDAAIKDINKANSYLKILNGKTATAVALILFNVGSAALDGIIVLGDNDNTTRHTVVATLTAILWSLLVIFPFIQASRVTGACNKLLAAGPIIRGRPLQYVDSPQLELDSFSIFTVAITMRAEIFGVPVYPWMVYLTTVSFAFVLLLLCQTGDYWYTEWL